MSSKKQIVITVDTNDADYNTSINVITDEDLKKLMPLIKAIKTFQPYQGKYGLNHHNYPNGEYAYRPDLGVKTPRELYPSVNEEAFQIFEDLAPYGEYGYHSIESIELITGTTKKLL